MIKVPSGGNNRAQVPKLRYRPPLPWEEYEDVATPSEFPTVTDYVFKALNRRFLDYYDLLLGLITTLEVDDLDTRSLVRNTNKVEASQIFTAYRGYSPYCRNTLVNSILIWRTQQLNKKTEWSDYFKENSHPKLQGKDSWSVHEEKKVLLVNYLWAKLTYLILHDRFEGEQLETQTAIKIKEVCFSMLTGQTSKLRCFESNFSVFLHIVSGILDILSSTLALNCLDRANIEMEKLDPNKSATDYHNVLEGIKGLSLNVYDTRSSPEVVKLCTKLSNLVNLKNKIKMPDSIRGSLFDCFTHLLSNITANTPKAVLAAFASANPLPPPSSSDSPATLSPSSSSSHLASEGVEGPVLTPPNLLSELPSAWYPLMEELHTRLNSMTKKGKNLTWALPLQAVALCCCRKSVINESLSSYMDILFRHIKPGEKMRSVVLESIFRLLHTTFVWLEDDDEIIDKICKRVAREITQCYTKTRTTPQEDQVSFFVDIITLISIKRLDFATNEIVLQFLKLSDRDLKAAEVNAERVIIGLLSAKSICELLGISSSAHLVGSTKQKRAMESDLDAPNFRRRAISQMKREETLYLNSDTLLYGCGGALDNLLPLLDSQFGNFLMTTQIKPIGDLVPTSKMPQLELLETALSCLSFALPLKMEVSALVAMLLRCSLHLFEPVKTLSSKILQNFIENRPFIRSTILNEFGIFMRGFKDDCVDHLLSSVGLLCCLLGKWYTLACTEVTAHYHQVDCGPQIDVVGFEASILLLLCRCDSSIRFIAFEALKLFTDVCEISPSHLVKSPPHYLFHVLQNNEHSVLERSKYVPSSLLFDSELFEEQKTIGTEDLVLQPVEIVKPTFNPGIRSQTMGSAATGHLPGLPSVRSIGPTDVSTPLSARGTRGDPARPGNSTVGVVGGGGVGGVPELRRSPSAHFRGFAGASGAVVVGGGAAGGAAAAGGVGGGVGGVGERGGEEGGFFLGGGEEAGWVCVLGEILRVVGVECGESSACLHSISVGKMEAALENWNDADKSTDSTLFYYRWRNYLVAAVATVGACTTKQPIQALLKQILPLVKSVEPRNAAALCFAMEFISPLVLTEVLQGLQPFSHEVSKVKKIGSKKDPIRIHLANIVRCCAQALCYKLLDEPLQSFRTYQCVQSVDKNAFKGRDELLQLFVLFQNESFQFLGPHADSQANCINWTVLSLKYCLFTTLTAVIRGAFTTSTDRHGIVFHLDMRKELFHFAMKFLGYGASSKAQKAHEQKTLEEMSAKLKTQEEKNSLKIKMRESVQMVELAAGEALRCLLLGRGFEEGLFDAAGPLYEVVSSLFHSQDNVMVELGKKCLLDFAESNRLKSEVSKVFIDKSYFVDPQISQNFFICLADSIMRLGDMSYDVCACLLLCMFKLGDPNDVVRRHAVRLVHYVCQKHFRNTGGYTYFVSPDLSISPSFVANIVRLSTRLASDRPELTYSLLDEVMQRSPALDITMQRRIFMLFIPWVSNVNFIAHPEKVKSVMTNLLVLTIKHGQERQEDAEKMWKLLAGREGNVTHILDFLFQIGIVSQNKEGLYYCKQVVLYVARAAPHPTINHLVSQLSSFDVRALGLEKVARGTAANPYSWVLSELVPYQAYQEPFCKCYFSLALLSDVCVEHGSVCEPHLAKIMHSIFLAGDRRNELITSNALCLLHNLCVTLLSSRADSEPSLSSLFEKIDSFHGSASFWAYENITRENVKLKSTEKLTSCVEFFINLLDWKVDLTENWGKEALRLAVSTDSVHLLARSLQVFRALQPMIKLSSLTHILRRYRQFLMKKESVDVGLELLFTLEEAVRWSDRDTIIAIPQFFWTAVAFLLTNDPVEYVAAVSFLDTVLERTQFGTETTQKYLLHSFPYEGWNPPFQGFLPFLLKGTTHQESERVTLDLIAEVASLPQVPIIDIDPKRRVLMNSICLLPYLCLYMGKENTSKIASALSGMFLESDLFLENAHGLEKSFLKYSTGDFETMELFAEQISEDIATAFFPQYEVLVFTLLIEMLERGGGGERRGGGEGGRMRVERGVMVLIDYLLSHVRLEVSSLQTRGLALFAPVEARLISCHFSNSLSVTKRFVSSLPPGQIQVAHAKHMNVIQRLGDFSEISSTWSGKLDESSRQSMISGLNVIMKSTEKEKHEKPEKTQTPRKSKKKTSSRHHVDNIVFDAEQE